MEHSSFISNGCEIYFPSWFAGAAEKALSELSETVGFIGDKWLDGARAAPARPDQEVQVLQAFPDETRATLGGIHQGHSGTDHGPNGRF